MASPLGVRFANTIGACALPVPLVSRFARGATPVRNRDPESGSYSFPALEGRVASDDRHSSSDRHGAPASLLQFRMDLSQIRCKLLLLVLDLNQLLHDLFERPDDLLVRRILLGHRHLLSGRGHP